MTGPQPSEIEVQDLGYGPALVIAALMRRLGETEITLSFDDVRPLGAPPIRWYARVASDAEPAVRLTLENP